MAWDEYRKQKVRRYTFEEFGCPEFWVELKSLSQLSWGQAKKFQEMDVSDPVAIAQGEEILIWAIQDWYILDPTVEGEVLLPLPKDDPKSLDKLPTEFVSQMHSWIAEAMEEFIPPTNETSSGQA